jgi:hypothetical protein
MLRSFRRALLVCGAVCAVGMFDAQTVAAAPAGKVVATHDFTSYVVGVAVDTGYNRTYVLSAPVNSTTTVLQVIDGATQTIAPGSLTFSGLPHEGGIAVDKVTHTVFVGTANLVRRIAVNANSSTPFLGATYVTSGALTAAPDFARRFAFNAHNGKLYAVVDGPSASAGGFRILDRTFAAGTTGTLIVYPSPTDVAVDPETDLVFAASSYQNATPYIRVYYGTALKGSIPTATPPRLASAWRLAVARTSPTVSDVYYRDDPYCNPSSSNCNGGGLSRFSYAYTGGVGGTFSASAPSVVSIGSAPGAVAYNPVSQRIYATMPSGGDVSIVDVLTATEMDSVSLQSPTASGVSLELAVNPTTFRVYLVTGHTPLPGSAVKVLAECSPIDDPPSPCPATAALEGRTRGSPASTPPVNPGKGGSSPPSGGAHPVQRW